MLGHFAPGLAGAPPPERACCIRANVVWVALCLLLFVFFESGEGSPPPPPPDPLLWPVTSARSGAKALRGVTIQPSGRQWYTLYPNWCSFMWALSTGRACACMDPSRAQTCQFVRVWTLRASRHANSCVWTRWPPDMPIYACLDASGVQTRQHVRMDAAGVQTCRVVESKLMRSHRVCLSFVHVA